MATNDHGERIAAVISLTELGYPKPTWDGARKLVARLNRDAAFIVLAQFNLFLAVASIQADQNGDLKPRRFAQEKIISNIISAKRPAARSENHGRDFSYAKQKCRPTRTTIA